MSTLHDRGRDFLERNLWSSARTETVSVRAEASDDWTTDVTAFRRVASQDEQPVEGGILPVGAITFHLRASTLPDGTIIAPGWEIKDADDVIYSIPLDFAKAVSLEAWETRWRCVAVKQV